MVEQIPTIAMSCVVTAVMGFLIGQVGSLKGRMRAKDQADKYMLKNSITRACLSALKADEIHHYELESICDMFKVYKALGGNSYVESLVDKVKKLRIVQD